MTAHISRIVILILAATALAAARVEAEEAPPSVPHYDVDLRIDPFAGIITGDIAVKVPWEQSRRAESTRVHIVLMLNQGEKRNPNTIRILEDRGPKGFDPSWAKIENVQIDGIPAEHRFRTPLQPIQQTYNTEHLVVEIDIPKGIEPESSLQLTFSYQAHLPNTKGMDDFYFEDQMISRFTWFPMILPADSDIDNIPHAEYPFTYEGNIEVPDDWMMAAIGSEFGRDDSGIYSFASTAPVATLPLVFLQGYDIYETGYGAGCILRIYHLPGNEGIARLVASYSTDVLEYYERIYFPLDYRYVSIIQGYPGVYGMAADSIAIIGDGAFGGVDRVIPGILDPVLDFLLTHELGHFYFGIGTMTDFSRENYLSEGLCEYSSLRYIEDKYGIWGNIYNRDLRDIFADFLISSLGDGGSTSWRGQKLLQTAEADRQNWDTPISGEPEDKILNSMTVMDYDRAFLVIEMLAGLLGRDRFDDAIRNYLQEHLHRRVDSETFRSSLESYFDRDLGLFFDRYVYGDGSVDYGVEGLLNQRADGDGYESTIEVVVSDEDAEFIPTTITAFLKDGSSQQVPFASEGVQIVNTAQPVKYLGIDVAGGLLDYERRNNFYPRQVAPAWTDADWLKHGGATLWSVWPILLNYGDTQPLGYGPVLYDKTRWSVVAGPVFMLKLQDVSDITANLPELGAALQMSLDLPRSAAIGADIAVSVSGVITGANLSLSKTFFFPQNIGLRPRYFYPVLGLRNTTGLMDWDIVNGGLPTLTNSTSISFDLLATAGIYTVIGNDLRYHLSSGSLEERLSAGVETVFSFIPRVLFGIGVSGSHGFGTLADLAVGNEVLGWGSTLDVPASSRVAARGFIGFPVANNIEIQMLNLIVLQSINAGLVYEAATAFTDPSTVLDRTQHALGIEVIPVIRTFRDYSLSLGIGLSLNISRIAANPADLTSYFASLFLDASLASGLYSAATSF